MQLSFKSNRRGKMLYRQKYIYTLLFIYSCTCIYQCFLFLHVTPSSSQVSFHVYLKGCFQYSLQQVSEQQILSFRLPTKVIIQGFPGGSELKKNPPANAEDAGVWIACLIPGLGRSPGGGNDNPLQHSCLENSTDRGPWQVPVHGVTRLSD